MLPLENDTLKERRWVWRLSAAVLILGTAILRIWYLAHDCPLDLACDEAHYWDWSRHLDWSYYSKGPLVALLIRISCECFGSWSRDLTGTEMLAVRLPAVVCGSLLLMSVYVLTVQVYRRERWALAAVGIALTLPLIAAGSTLMTIDAPFTCAWGWALVFGHRAVFRGSLWAWIATGICVLIGILAKHTMVLWVPFLGLFLLTTPGLRPWLWSGRFWLMTLIGALGGVSILLWNLQHDWVTLKHTQNHAGVHDEWSWIGPLRYLGMQFAVLLGFWFIAWARAAWAHRPTREVNAEVRYLWWLSIPVVAFFLLFSVHNGGGEANWPVAGYISGMVLTVGWIAEELRRPLPVYRRLAVAGVLLTCSAGLALSIAVHEPVALQPLLASVAGAPTPDNPAPLRRFDPTCRLRGWRLLAAEVDRLRSRLREQGVDVVLACDMWSVPGEIAFYLGDHPQVYSLGLALGDRHSQYDLWHPNPITDPQAFAGKTFLVIGSTPMALQAGFVEVDNAGVVQHVESGQVLAAWPLTIGRHYRGFPQRPTGGF
jgi:4-amino-4-deoxy-L-arabinose transferase-like glycosyltransferase